VGVEDDPESAVVAPPDGTTSDPLLVGKRLLQLFRTERQVMDEQNP
jgi:hypothetical protein